MLFFCFVYVIKQFPTLPVLFVLHVNFIVFLFVCTGEDIEPYLPTLMKTMLCALNNSENLKIKELAVSAIGAIGKYFTRMGPEILAT